MIFWRLQDDLGLQGSVGMPAITCDSIKITAILQRNNWSHQASSRIYFPPRTQPVHGHSPCNGNPCSLHYPGEKKSFIHRNRLFKSHDVVRRWPTLPSIHPPPSQSVLQIPSRSRLQTPSSPCWKPRPLPQSRGFGAKTLSSANAPRRIKTSRRGGGAPRRAAHNRPRQITGSTRRAAAERAFNERDRLHWAARVPYYCTASVRGGKAFTEACNGGPECRALLCVRGAESHCDRAAAAGALWRS